MSMSATDIILLVTAIIGLLTALTSTTLCACLPKRYAYLWNFEAHRETLRREKARLVRLISEADRQLKDTMVRRSINSLKDWKTGADELVLEINQSGIENPESSLTWCTKCGTGDRIAQKIEEINSRTQEYGSIMDHVRESSIKGEKKIAKELVGKNATDAVENICSHVTGDKVRIIGVSGESGIGKTEVVKKVNDRIINEENAIDFVIWVDVSKETPLVNLQRELASKIDPSISIDDDTNRNAGKLRVALVRKRRFLLILDDVQSAFNLTDVGIPEPTVDNGCKLIIVSRFSNVCHAMGTDKIVNMELLSPEEAWILFSSEVGREEVHSEEIKSIMQNVANECGRLPKTVIETARALRDLPENPKAWEKELWRKRLKFRYNDLQEEENGKTKACFLYCALYPEDCAIETTELMEYWIWEGLLGDVNNLPEKMNGAKEILEKIIEARLLERAGEEGGVELVKMPAISRDMALDITKSDPIFFIDAGHGKKNPASARAWPPNVQRVSMMKNKFEEFPFGVPDCRQLCSLLLQYNTLESKNVCEDTFFDGLPNLKVLDLSHTGIRRLPESFERLQKLRALILRYCLKLEGLPTLSALSELLVLDLTDTPIQELPTGMTKLTKLKRLSFTRSKSDKLIFGPRVRKALKNLEELLLDGSGFYLDVASKRDDAWLERLSVLEVNFLNAQACEEYFSSNRPYKLQRFKVSVGRWCNGYFGNNSVPFEGLAGGKPIKPPNNTSERHVIGCDDMIKLPAFKAEHLKILEVSDCSNLEYLFEMIMMKYLENVKEIIVKRCPKMVALLKQQTAKDHVELIELSKLQNLVLYDLQKLECIYDGRVVECKSLKTIDVWNCPQLKKFPVWAQAFEGSVEIKAERAWFESLPPDEKESLRHFLKDRYDRVQSLPPSNNLIEESSKSAGKAVVHSEDSNKETSSDQPPSFST